MSFIRTSRARVVAVAAVIENDDGTTTMIGSRSVREFTYSMECDVERMEVDWSPMRVARKVGQSFTLEAVCDDLHIHRAYEDRGPIALPQRGLYLPNGAFKALPD